MSFINWPIPRGLSSVLLSRGPAQLGRLISEVPPYDAPELPGGPILKHPGLQKGWVLWRRGSADPLAVLSTAGELPRPTVDHTDAQLSLLGQLEAILDGAPAGAAGLFLTPVGMKHPKASNAITLERFLETGPKHRPGLLKDAMAGTLSGEGIVRQLDRAKHGRRRTAGAGLQGNAAGSATYPSTPQPTPERASK